MYRAGAKEWTDEERRAIAAFVTTFKPEWESRPASSAIGTTWSFAVSLTPTSTITPSAWSC